MYWINAEKFECGPLPWGFTPTVSNRQGIVHTREQGSRAVRKRHLVLPYSLLPCNRVKFFSSAATFFSRSQQVYGKVNGHQP